MALCSLPTTSHLPLRTRLYLRSMALDKKVWVASATQFFSYKLKLKSCNKCKLIYQDNLAQPFR